MTDAQAALAQVREALAAGPTPGEWRYIVDDGDRKLTAEVSGSFMCDTAYYPWCPDNEGDWKLIAACSPANMSAILAHVEAQKAENERLTAERDELRERLVRAEASVEEMCADSWQLRKTISRVEAERDELRRRYAEAQQRAEYWKAEHLAGNKEIDELRRQLDPMGEYASADELIAALRAEKAADDAMKQDAQRYRWLRGREDGRYMTVYAFRTDIDEVCLGDELDAAIDAAMGLTRPAEE